MSVTDIKSHKDFTDIINRDEISLIYFWATWCGPCEVGGPIFEDLSRRHPEVKCYKVDVDEHSDVAKEAGVREMPTFIGFKNGEKTGDSVGVNPVALEALAQRLS